MRRVFITGGTGFFGQAVMRSKPSDVQALILSRTKSGPGYLTGDVRTFEFPAGKFDAILHMSLESEGTDRVIEFARHANVKRVLFTSSGAVYRQQTEYAHGKRKAERLLLSAKGIDALIARCFAFVGPGIPLENFAIGNFIRDAIKGNRIEVKGSSVRSYLYTSDLAEWLWTMLDRAPAGSIFDVGSEEAVTMLQLADAVRQVINPHAEIVTTGTEGTRYIPNTKPIRDCLGVQQKVNLHDAIRLTWESLQ